MDQFVLKAPYAPSGDQPQAIEVLAEGVKQGLKNQILLGVTGSGKTFTMASADHLVPPVPCTSATLDIFQVLKHSKFFSTLATIHLLSIKKHIFLNLHLSGVFSSPPAGDCP